MPSQEAISAKRHLIKEVVDPKKLLATERRDWDTYSLGMPVSPDVAIEMVEIAGTTCARLRPTKSKSRATILYAHGGGLTTGSISTHRSLASELAAATNCNVVLPQYRLLPENHFSAPSDDVLAVYAHFVGSSTNAEGPVFLGGDSSGGGLALTVACRSIEQGLEPPAACFTISGAFDATLAGASHNENEDIDPILSGEVLRHWQSQLGDDVDLGSPMISPLFGDLSNLPPILLLAGEDEVWLDDTKRMYAALTNVGVECQMQIYEGMWHVWPMTANLPETQDAFFRISEFIRRHLNARA